MSIPVTLLYGGLNALVTLALGMNVSRIRGQTKTFLGDAGNERLTRAIRVHGNNAEWVPLGIALLLMLELGGMGSLMLHALGGALLLGRLLHAHGMYAKAPTSVAGAVLNYLTIGAMAVTAVIYHFLSP